MRCGGRWEARFYVPAGVTIAATNSGGTGTSVAIAEGWYTPSSFCAYLQARLNAERTPATWTVTLSVGANGTGLVTIDCAGETWALTFTTTLVRTLLGFDANITSTTDPATATTQCKGLWFPEAHLLLKTDPWRAPKRVASTATEGPNGQVITYAFGAKYKHTGARYTNIPRARVFDGEASTPGSSLEQWLDDTQYGDGHAWFRVGSAFQIYSTHQGADRIVGADLNAGAGPSAGWKFSPAFGAIEDRISRTSGNYLGEWTLELPSLVSEG